MTSRRAFLGGALAVAAGWAGLGRKANVGGGPPAMVDFYSRAWGDVEAGGGPSTLGVATGRLGEPARVDPRSLEVGHFRDLVHEGDGRIAYLYDAALSGPIPRRGYVKLDRPC